jgi:hypothetical protein
VVPSSENDSEGIGAKLLNALDGSTFSSQNNGPPFVVIALKKVIQYVPAATSMLGKVKLES